MSIDLPAQGVELWPKYCAIQKQFIVFDLQLEEEPDFTCCGNTS